MSKNCGKCAYSKYDSDEQDYVCSNEESENYGLPTEYNGGCLDWEERE